MFNCFNFIESLKKNNTKTIRRITNKRNRGNKSNKDKWKLYYENQDWILFLIETENFKTCHSRSLAGRVVEKNGINGLKNKLDHFSCYIDIKLYIEKYYSNRIKNIDDVKEIYKSINTDIWDDIGDEIFNNRIKSRSTFSEYHSNRNKNTIQGIYYIKFQKNFKLVWK